MKLYLIILGSALFAGCSSAVKKDVSMLNENVEYGRQVALAKNFSKETDFTALRMAYTDTDDYSPYAAKDIKPIMDALQKKDFGRCRRLALRYLDREFVSLAANYAAMVCHKELGKEDISNRYRFILNGLLDSIFDSGDGRSTDTAFVTISGEELYSFIRLSGLTVESQSLIRKDGRVFDLMKVVDPETDERVNLYFDVTLQTTKGLKFLQR